MSNAVARVEQVEIPERVLRPEKGWIGFGLGELWAYRELALFFAWRTILIRYKQTALGLLWVLLQPLLLMVVLTFFFGSFAKKANVPGPVFFFSGLVPWTYFATALTSSSQSLVGNANLLSKTYFPRLIAPLSATVAVLVDFALSFVILIVMMLLYGLYPRPIAIVVLPAMLLLAFITALGAGLWLSAMNVSYRDVQYIVPFFVQIGLFISGVAFATGTIREPWRTVLGLNPLAGVVSGFRWALLRNQPPPGPMLGVSVAVSILLLVSGMIYFRRMERGFADVI